MKPFREHILPFHHEIVHVKVSKCGEINNNSVRWITRHTDGQYDDHGEIAIPTG
jgi:hypothetical protein